MSARVSFIGLGVMGKPMAGHLVDAGLADLLQERAGIRLGAGIA